MGEETVGVVGVGLGKDLAVAQNELRGRFLIPNFFAIAESSLLVAAVLRMALANLSSCFFLLAVIFKRSVL